MLGSFFSVSRLPPPTYVRLVFFLGSLCRDVFLGHVVPLKVLFVSPEVEPFVKVGGLADMVGSLPKALAALGHDVRVIFPAYGSLRLDSAWHARPEPLGVDVGPEARWARTWESVLPDSTGQAPPAAAPSDRAAVRTDQLRARRVRRRRVASGRAASVPCSAHPIADYRKR